MSKSTSCCALSGIRSSAVFKRAKKEFGTTRDPNEAGWLLPDGSMLDFSEKNEGGPPGGRSLDHRAIERVVPHRDGENRYLVMMKFCSAGAVRLNNHANVTGMNVCRPLSPEQRDALRQMAMRSTLVMADVTCEGERIESKEWDRDERDFYPSAPVDWADHHAARCVRRKKRRR